MRRIFWWCGPHGDVGPLRGGKVAEPHDDYLDVDDLLSIDLRCRVDGLEPSPLVADARGRIE